MSVAERCEADKLRTAGKYANCGLKGEPKEVKKGVPQDAAFDRCDLKYEEQWNKVEIRAKSGPIFPLGMAFGLA